MIKFVLNNFYNFTFNFPSCSLISTPPPERVPIKTHLSAFTKEKVLSAIGSEVERGGQVFYVLPRIKGNTCMDIYSIYFIQQTKKT